MLRCEPTRGSAIHRPRDDARSSSSILRLTLELVTVGDFALPVAGLFVQVKGQSAGACDLLQAGPCTPAGAGTENKTDACMSLSGEKDVRFRLLSSWSQFFTFVFQSQVCRSMSNARPVGHRTVASLVTPISVALSHLRLFPYRERFARLTCAKLQSGETNQPSTEYNEWNNAFEANIRTWHRDIAKHR